MMSAEDFPSARQTVIGAKTDFLGQRTVFRPKICGGVMLH